MNDAENKINRQVDANHNRRMANEARMIDRQQAIWDRCYDAAEAMIGKLVREGKEVFYVMPIGGKYREGTRADLIAFLIRRGYA